MQNTERGYHHGRTKYIQSSLLICIQANASINHQNYGHTVAASPHLNQSYDFLSILAQLQNYIQYQNTQAELLIQLYVFTAMGMNKILHLEWNIYKLRILISHGLCFTFIPTLSITIPFIYHI